MGGISEFSHSRHRAVVLSSMEPGKRNYDITPAESRGCLLGEDFAYFASIITSAIASPSDVAFNLILPLFPFD